MQGFGMRGMLPEHLAIDLLGRAQVAGTVMGEAPRQGIVDG